MKSKPTQNTADRIAPRVKTLRAQRRWTALELATRAGVHVNSVYMVERAGSRGPRVDTLDALAAALGVHITDLVA
jgi:transcriptional regulator with XRE-family HTH domain